jgi:molybdopterin-containing oxidoreductase family iron-sulfur binding subunit
MNRLYVAEPCLTVTGSMADHRLRVRGSEVLGLAQALVAELSKVSGGESLTPLAGLPKAPTSGNPDPKWIAAVAKDLARVRGRGVVIAGRRQPAAVHALVNAINAALGNVGQGAAVTFWPAIKHDTSSGMESLRGLVEEIAAGFVDTLVITARNPVYGAPTDFKLDKLLARVPSTIYWGLYEDETAEVVSTFLPAAHTLESWGDGRALDGRASLVQPLIAPLWSGLTDADVLATFLGEGDVGSHQLLKKFWQTRAVSNGWTAGTNFEALWESWLAKGVIDKTTAQPEAGIAVNAGKLAEGLGTLVGQAPAKADGLEIAFTVDGKVFDGRFANNAWLQELPHPITKMTWDNAIIVSKATADRLGVETGDMARLESGDRKVTGPVYIQPGHADEAVTVALGYGRGGAEEIARGVGFNAGLLRTSAAPWFERGISLTKISGHHKFGITQDHWSMEEREPAMETPLKALLEEGSAFNKHVEERRAPVPSIHEPVDYSKQAYKWAMTIDLNKCTGCSACVVACQSENNIPVVGRENVRIGREMQWIRVDRYYSGSIEEPDAIAQPLMCVHCETAPCENVCPVNATVHSDEGLNEMVYNRCIGTRYCSNNCPYKVRRFNFLDYHGDVPHVAKMATNPDVTVRSRGVMEKCTYCVQRIERTRIDARIEDRAIQDGEILTACQQGCPSQAIEFGSLNDPSSRVSKVFQDTRRYNLLNDLGTRPRTVYLARVRNPNPELA